MPVLAVFDFRSTLFGYLIFSYDNFPYPGSRRYSEDETDRSAHSGSAGVVMKPITSSSPFPRWSPDGPQNSYCPQMVPRGPQMVSKTDNFFVLIPYSF